MSRPEAGYGTLEEVIKALSSGKYPELTYVGKQYTKASLIKDLCKIKEQLSGISAYGWKDGEYIDDIQEYINEVMGYDT